MEGEVSMSAFAYLFSEIVQYQSLRIQSAAELETGLNCMGHNVGIRVLEALVLSERQTRRETKPVAALQVLSLVC